MAVQFEKPIALGADHGGYALKEAIKQHLEERGIAYRDFGTNSTASCDYPDYAAATCGAVTNGSSDFHITKKHPFLQPCPCHRSAHPQQAAGSW